MPRKNSTQKSKHVTHSQIHIMLILLHKYHNACTSQNEICMQHIWILPQIYSKILGRCGPSLKESRLFSCLDCTHCSKLPWVPPLDLNKPLQVYSFIAHRLSLPYAYNGAAALCSIYTTPRCILLLGEWGTRVTYSRDRWTSQHLDLVDKCFRLEHPFLFQIKCNIYVG